MAEIIAFASGKGGVGKSTTAVSCAGYFAKKGKKVLLIDGDVCLNSLDIMLGLRDKIIFGWTDVADGRSEAQNAIIESENGIHLLASPSKTDNPYKLKEIVDSVKDNYDYVFIDSPAGIGEDFIHTVSACQRLIIIATADEVSVYDAFRAFKQAEGLGLQSDDIRLLINRYDRKKAEKSRLLNIDGVIDKTGIRLLGIIPECKNVMYSTVTGKIKSKKFYSAVERICKRIDGINVDLKV